MADEDLLKILEAHGQQFLQSFDSRIAIGKRKEGPTLGIEKRSKRTKLAETEPEEEWAGITGLGSGPSEDEADGSETSEGNDTDEEQDEDDGDGMSIWCICLAENLISQSLHARGR